MKKDTSQDAAEVVLENGFGFDPLTHAAHFLLRIPLGAEQEVQISEHLSWDSDRIGLNVHPAESPADGQLKSSVARHKWDLIADPVRAEFNTRLKAQGAHPGKWKSGCNALSRALGKELCLLFWAIEDADPGVVPQALANWQGLAPEERWWLYTMTAAATGSFLTGRNLGWRKAIRYALTENPLQLQASKEERVPAFFRLAEAAPALMPQGTVEPLFEAEAIPSVPAKKPRSRKKP